MYYFGVRYYAAWLGRWTSSDPGGFIDGLNLYRYVRNNPVNLVDPDGMSPDPPPECPDCPSEGTVHYSENGYLYTFSKGQWNNEGDASTFAVRYEVGSGESPHSIADKMGIPVEDIVKYNASVFPEGLKDDTWNIDPGDILNIANPYGTIHKPSNLYYWFNQGAIIKYNHLLSHPSFFDEDITMDNLVFDYEENISRSEHPDLYKSTLHDNIRQELSQFRFDPMAGYSEVLEAGYQAADEYIEKWDNRFLVASLVFGGASVTKGILKRTIFKNGLFSLRNGYGVFGKKGFKMGSYRVDALYGNPNSGIGHGTYLSIRQIEKSGENWINKRGGTLWRWDYGKLHSGGVGNHSSIRFTLFGKKYGSSAQRTFFPSTIKPPFFKALPKK